MIQCPKCNSTENRVRETKHEVAENDEQYTTRKRVCECGAVLWTAEVLTEVEE